MGNKWTQGKGIILNSHEVANSQFSCVYFAHPRSALYIFLVMPPLIDDEVLVQGWKGVHQGPTHHISLEPQYSLSYTYLGEVWNSEKPTEVSVNFIVPLLSVSSQSSVNKCNQLPASSWV